MLFVIQLYIYIYRYLALMVFETIHEMEVSHIYQCQKMSFVLKKNA